MDSAACTTRPAAATASPAMAGGTHSPLSLLQPVLLFGGAKAVSGERGAYSK